MPADSTPTAVTVSDRMGETTKAAFTNALGEYINARYGYEAHRCSLCSQRMTLAHDRLWAMVSPHPDPAEETYMRHEVSAEEHEARQANLRRKPSLPQTLGEAFADELPAWVVRRIDHLRNISRRTQDERAILHLADSRSRLLTALEEWKSKETAVRKSHEIVSKRLAELESSSVLQKEELEQMTQKHEMDVKALNWWRKELAQRDVQLEDEKRRADSLQRRVLYLEDQSPTSGA